MNNSPGAQLDDSATFDSARITNLSGININYDSADFSIIKSTAIFGDSARITSISGTGDFNFANGHISNLYVDSAGIVNASVENFDANIANISNISSTFRNAPHSHKIIHIQCYDPVDICTLT